MSDPSEPDTVLSPAAFAIARVGIGIQQTFADALIEATGFVIPRLPKLGRNSRSMTQMQFAEIVRGTLNGLRVTAAGKKAGVPRKTILAWMSQGEADVEDGVRSAQACFWRTISQAQVIGQEYATQTLMLHAQKDWRAAHALLRDVYDVGKPAAASQDDSGKSTEEDRRARLRKRLPTYSRSNLPDVIDAPEDPDEDVFEDGEE